jgi:hypothetical protein
VIGEDLSVPDAVQSREIEELISVEESIDNQDARDHGMVGKNSLESPVAIAEVGIEKKAIATLVSNHQIEKTIIVEVARRTHA